jgi:hypothetical protein
MQSMSSRRFAPRLTAPRCRGGASSLLRLSQGVPGRWPSATELSEWAGRLARTDAAAPTRTPAAGAASQWFTRLVPGAA